MLFCNFVWQVHALYILSHYFSPLPLTPPFTAHTTKVIIPSTCIFINKHLHQKIFSHIIQSVIMHIARILLSWKNPEASVIIKPVQMNKYSWYVLFGHCCDNAAPTYWSNQSQRNVFKSTQDNRECCCINTYKWWRECCHRCWTSASAVSAASLPADPITPPPATNKGLIDWLID